MSTKIPTILIVDDVRQRRDLLSAMLGERDTLIFEADSSEQALILVAEHDPDLIITETELPARSGLYLLREVKRLDINCEVILVTHNASSYNLLQAMRLGAFDFIVRPIDTSEILFNVVDRALKQLELRQENQRLMKELKQKNEALARSLEMMKALNLSIERVNRSHEVGELLGQLLDAAIESVDAESGLIALQRGTQDIFGVKISRGIPAAFCQAFHDQLPDGLLLDIARRGSPLTVEGRLPEELQNRISTPERDIFTKAGLLAVPIHHKNRMIGIMMLFGHPEGTPFTEQHLHFLIQLSHHTALALEKAGIIHQLKRRSQKNH